MNARLARRVFVLLALAFPVLTPFMVAQDQPPTPQPPKAEGQLEQLPAPKPGELRPEILTRGQVHEAYASPTQLNPKPGQTVQKAPPPLVNELPPEQKPAGDNVKWIPGYWAWDGQKNDHIWISGCWRNIPPGREWVGGYWAKTDDGAHRWISGYWAKGGEGEARYVPQPPATLENGPSTPAPGDNYIWAPGGWVYYGGRHLWRPGCWTPYQEDWVWTPACYTYTPAGYVWNDGFWDYSLASRGLMFAPAYFGASPWYGLGAWGWGGWYRPSVYIGWGGMLDCLWCSPWGGYCFGDYWGGFGFGIGFGFGFGWGGCWPWWGHHNGTWCGDHHHHSHGHSHAWHQQQAHNFMARAANPALRPARTLAAQQAATKAGGAAGLAQSAGGVGKPALAQPLSHAVASQHLQPVSGAQAKEISQQTRTAQHAFADRAKAETAAGKGQTTSPRTLARSSSTLASNAAQPFRSSAGQSNMATHSLMADHGSALARSSAATRSFNPYYGTASQPARPQLANDHGHFVPPMTSQHNFQPHLQSFGGSQMHSNFSNMSNQDLFRSSSSHFGGGSMGSSWGGSSHGFGGGGHSGGGHGGGGHK